MSVIRVTKEFHFEMAHALLGYDGPCRHIHGHSYKLLVTVRGKLIDEENNPKLGMLIDFSDLKNIINKEIIQVFDHALALNRKANIAPLQPDQGMFSKMVILDYQPTCENLVADFANRIKKLLPTEIELFSLCLYETATSYTEWFALDNL
jgi:6-pyruvoyltetrahydropterin/6-carboxytetrahydropterin synthase